ncbi:MAG: histidine phosphatase family protein [Ruminococcus sp.]|nr:histidine phosphatase family protein [Ruminococcus sp.]
MQSYVIHFIRHGDIADTLKGKYIGTTDVSLSDEGRQNLVSYDRKYIYPGAQVVFTSPLRRCTETARILYPDLKPIVIDQLAECSFGEWENKSADDLKDDEIFQKWLAGKNGVKPPDGESGLEFTNRICDVFEQIVDGLVKTGNTEAVIITHGGVIMTLLSVYGIPRAKPFEWVMDNGFGYSVRVNPMMWQRDKVAEVYRRIPVMPEDNT